MLDETQKKCYHSCMENLETVNRRIARNLTRYRKAAGLTQAELAQKINYSDKSVSKWESGNGVPDIYIFLRLAELYGVTVNDLVGEEPSAPKKGKAPKGRNIFVALLSSGLVWLVATAVFVLLKLFLPGGPWWAAFLYAVPANAIVITVLASVWKYRMVNFISVTALIWSALACVYVTSALIIARIGAQAGNLWLIFLLGVPLQVLEVLWYFFRWTLFRGRNGTNGARKADGREKQPDVEKTDGAGE